MLKLDLSISCLQEIYLTGKEEHIALGGKKELKNSPSKGN